MSFLLDTNVVSELRKVGSAKASERVVQWVQSVDADALYLSVVTVMELKIGALQVERRDPVQGEILRTWLDRHVLPQFADRVLSIDLEVAHRCASLHVPDRRSDRDALIAATALVHRMIVVTRNTSDFEPTGVPVLDPWTGRSSRKI